MSRPLTLILAAFGGGAPNHGAEDGPAVVEHSQYWPKLQHAFDKIHHLHTKKLPAHLAPVRATHLVAQFDTLLRDTVHNTLHEGNLPLILGGDHTIAMGTWSGVVETLGDEALGLIWIDAHMDAHTRHTSLSQAVHGMPVAVLLGQGESDLLGLSHHKPMVAPTHFILMGARSYEPGEAQLLNDLGVKVYFDAEIKSRGFETCFQEALHALEKTCARVGVSLDLDAIDPTEIPGVGSRTPNGLHAEEVKKALHGFLCHPKSVAMEIAEYNPHKDEKEKTLKFIVELIEGVTHP